MLHIYCGDGKGKSTAATGLALRALGSGKRVLFVQFFKNGDSGEVALLKSLAGLTYLKSAEDFALFAYFGEAQKQQAIACYSALLQQAAQMAEGFDLVVLDEAVSAYQYGYLPKAELLALCKCAQGSAVFEVVLTGRNPDQALCDLSDYLSEVQCKKHPYQQGVPARKGIEF